jgi:hypothetical protein
MLLVPCLVQTVALIHASFAAMECATSLCHTNASIGQRRIVLLEGRHHFLGQESQAPVHGFLGQEPTGIQFGGDAGDP